MTVTEAPRLDHAEPPEEAAPPATGLAREQASTAHEAGEPSWARPALVALLVLTAVAYLWDLSASGYANNFYAAAVQAGTKSWKAFFFGSLDSSNFITVDKPPGSLWVMELSGRLFGFSSWSMLVPQALEGVAAVGILYATVKRWFGAPAGLLCGAVLAVTPVAALMFRFNNPDALLTLLLVASAYTLVRAMEKGGSRWMVATGTLLGFAFLTKMLQAFTVVPAFFLVYLIATPTSLRRRLSQLGLGAWSVIISAGWWVAAVALWPASSRPLIDGSPDNSIINLIFDYNGLGRLFGGSGPGGGAGGGGANFSGATGVFRLFDAEMGGQASWLIPVALLTVIAGVAWRRRAPRTDRIRAGVMLWGGWLIVTGAVFSFGQGVIHTYYTVALAPAIAALAGIGATLLWRRRGQLSARLIGAAGLLGTAVWAAVLLHRTPDYHPWLGTAVLVAATLASVVLVAAPLAGRFGSRALAVAIGVGVTACLAAPLAFTATTLSTAHTGSIPSAGPAAALGAQGGLPGGGASGGGAPGGGGRPFGLTAHGESLTTPSAAKSAFGAPPRGGQSSSTSTGGVPGTNAGGNAGGGAGGRASGGAGGGQTVNAALTAALKSDASSYRWAAATFGSQTAATLELASGEPVMAIGGFNGQGGNISLATFESYVLHGDVHYFIVSGTDGGGGALGRQNGQNADAAITTWVESHFSAKSIGGQTVYDLRSPSR